MSLQLLARRHKFNILELENLVECCSLMLARRHAFDIFEWDALCCEQRRSFFPILVFSLEVNIYSAEMHSHMNVDLCKIF